MEIIQTHTRTKAQTLTLTLAGPGVLFGPHMENKQNKLSLFVSFGFGSVMQGLWWGLIKSLKGVLGGSLV